MILLWIYTMSFTRKNLENGESNPKYVDLLEEDKGISGQKFVCVSFVSPENILKQKQDFMFGEFVKAFDFEKSMKKYNHFLNFISYKYNMDFEKLSGDFQEFVKEERDNLIDNSVSDEYKNFLDMHEERLEKEFGESSGFQTSTRGLKIRGSFETQQEAELRCKMLREVDPNHDIYVAPVGMWVPWEPEAYKTGRVEYLEEELNQLMHEKTKNETKAKQEFDARVKDAKRKAIEENIENAKQSGNKLTQAVDEEGNLIGVANMSTAEQTLGENATGADIRKELFEGENIRTKETDEVEEQRLQEKFGDNVKIE